MAQLLRKVMFVLGIAALGSACDPYVETTAIDLRDPSLVHYTTTLGRPLTASGKPVVVSMGTYGASGGYWIASQASEIVAEPSTLTGSIGVFGGKFVLGPALARFGVDVRDISVGSDYASAFSSGSSCCRYRPP